MTSHGLERALAAGPGWPPGLSPQGPLGGVRVLDLSRVLAGPYCCMVLADLGADVLKVERPGLGDDTRHWGPPFHGDDAAYFFSVNRDRRSVALDLTTPGGPGGRRAAGRGGRRRRRELPAAPPRRARPGGAARRAASAVWVSVRGAGGDGPDGDAAGLRRDGAGAQRADVGDRHGRADQGRRRGRRRRDRPVRRGRRARRAARPRSAAAGRGRPARGGRVDAGQPGGQRAGRRRRRRPSPATTTPTSRRTDRCRAPTGRWWSARATTRSSPRWPPPSGWTSGRGVADQRRPRRRPRRAEDRAGSRSSRSADGAGVGRRSSTPPACRARSCRTSRRCPTTRSSSAIGLRAGGRPPGRSGARGRLAVPARRASGRACGAHRRCWASTRSRCSPRSACTHEQVEEVVGADQGGERRWSAGAVARCGPGRRGRLRPAGRAQPGGLEGLRRRRQRGPPCGWSACGTSRRPATPPTATPGRPGGSASR